MTTPASNLPEGTPAGRKPKTNFRPILITLLCTLLLAAGSCFGFMSTVRIGGSGNSGSPLVAEVFAVGFVIGALAFLVAFLVLLVVFIRSVTGGS